MQNATPEPRANTRFRTGSSRTGGDRIPPGPLIWSLLPFGIGILIGWAFPLSSSVLLISGGVLVSLLIVTHVKHRPLLFALLLTTTALVAGAGRVAMLKRHAPNSVMHLSDGTVLEAEGHLSSVQQKTRTTPSGKEIPWSKSTLNVHRIHVNQTTRSARGKLQIYTFRTNAPFNAGERVRIEGMLSKRPPRRNPGDTEWSWYRVQNEMGGSLIVQTDEDWRYLSDGTPCTDAYWTRTRRWIHDQLQPDDQPFRFMPALLLGMRNTVDEPLESVFKKSGTVHFLAVSGLHVAVLLFGGFFLLRWLNVPPTISGVGLLLLLVLYLGVTGGRTPTVRASVMMGLLLLGLLIQRSIGSLQLLGIAAWILLLARPLDLFAPGFQFSFLAVTGLFLFAGPFGLRIEQQTDSPKQRLLQEFLWTERVKKYLRTAGAYVRSIVAATAVVLLVVGPLTVHHFHHLSPGSLIANPVLFLLLPVLLAAGYMHLLLVVLAGVGVPGVSILASGTEMLLHALEWTTIQTTSLIASLPGLHLFLPAPWWVLILLYYLFLLGLWWFYRRWGSERLMQVGSLLGVLLLLCSGLFRPSVSSKPSLTMLDVGHGASLILNGPKGRTILYDCGSTGYSDPGRWTTAPALWRRGETHIDLLILSHSDLDHTSGVKSLVERFSIGRIWISPYFDSFPEGEALVHFFQSEDVPFKRVTSGTTLQLGAMELDVFSPPGPEAVSFAPSTRSANALSLVVRARVANRSILFTGDLEEEGKHRFQQSTRRPDAVDLLQVPHHGGTGSAERSLARFIQTRYALISAARGRVAPRSVKQYRRRGARVLDTASRGALQLRWSRLSSRIQSFRWADGSWTPIWPVDPPHPFRASTSGPNRNAGN